MRKIGRNEPCPCGSGKKYKHCCWGKGFEWVRNEHGNVHRQVPLSRESQELLDNWRTEFRRQHGRDPYPDERIFHDLGHTEYVEAKMVDILKRAGIPPAFIYACEKTGRIVTERNKELLTDAELQEWKEAVDEYHRRVEQGDEPDI